MCFSFPVFSLAVLFLADLSLAVLVFHHMHHLINNLWQLTRYITISTKAAYTLCKAC